MLQTNAKKQVVIVDENLAGVEPLRQDLCALGYAARAVAADVPALGLIAQRPPHLVIIGWERHGLAALEFMQSVRRSAAHCRSTRLMILSGFCGDEYAVAALEGGADDYLTKPYSLREAVARVGVLLRAHELPPQARSTMSCDDLVLDATNGRVTAQGTDLELHGVEYRLLEFFMLHAGKTFNRSQLLDQVWGRAHEIDQRTVDVNVQRLRKILRGRGCGHYIQTLRGFGYRFAVPPAAAV